MSIVLCKLPKSGLGNQLFPLMHAMVFAHINRLPLLITGYHQLKIGPYLRNEKSKRNYLGYFNFQKSFLGELADKLKFIYFLNVKKRIDEPVLKIIKENAKSDTVFYFSKIPSYKDYFIYLKEHRNLVIELLDDCLNVEIKNNLFKGDSSGIGIHIRMGDFRKLNENEKFVGGHVRTPEKYFVSVINKIRKFIGSDFPAVVFTDGYTEEFDELKKMNAVTFHESKYDIVDLLNLSKCRIVVTSQGSTFSYWAGFLSNASVIHHPEHIHQKTRKVELGLYEGEFNENEFKLIQSLEKLKDIYS